MLLPVIVSALLYTAASPASAHNFSGATGSVSNCAAGNAGNVNMADAQPHTYYYDPNVNANNNVKIHQDWAWNSVYGPTTVNPLGQASPSASTDVVVYTQDYVNFCGQNWDPVGTLIGLVVCVSLNAGASTCEKHETRYDLSWWNSPVVDNAHRRNSACHETGHTLGLTHPDQNQPADNNSCMISVNNTVDFISEHDAMHVNGGPPRLVTGSAVLPDRLNRGEQASSWDGRYKLYMQTDGNLVVYDRGAAGTGWTPIWASSTSSSFSVWAVMQGDGNFVVYSSDGFGTWALCSTRTSGHPGAYISMQTDGNLVIYQNGTPIWASRGNVCN